MNDLNKQHLLELCDAACNDGLSEEQFARLETLLASDAECRQLYLRYLSLDTDLALTFGDRVPAQTALVSVVRREDSAGKKAGAQPAANQPRHSSSGRIASAWLRGVAHEFIEQPAPLAILVFSLISGGALIWGLSQLGPQHPQVTHQPPASGAPGASAPGGVAAEANSVDPSGAPSVPETRAVIARLKGTRNATWSETAWNVDSELRAGQRLSLKQGLAEIAFESGATVILEGPAEFEVGTWNAERGTNEPSVPTSTFQVPSSANACSLTLGKLFANVPPKAHGFTVHTPTMTIVDRGTRFGVLVKSEVGTSNVEQEDGQGVPRSTLHVPRSSTSVQVFQGQVDVQRHVAQASIQPAPVAKPIQLKTSEAVTSQPDSQPRKVEGNPAGYVRELPTAEPAQPGKLLPLPTWPKDSPLKPGDIVAAANTHTRFHLFKIDPRTGEQKLLATGMPYRQAPADHGMEWNCVAVEPDGNVLVGAKGIQAGDTGLLRIDPRSGQIKVVSRGGLLKAGKIEGLAVPADGTIYAAYTSGAHNDGGHVVKIDRVSGKITPLVRFGAELKGLGLDAGGRQLLACSRKDVSVGLVQLAPEPAAISWFQDMSLGMLESMAVSAAGRVFIGVMQQTSDGEGQSILRLKIFDVQRDVQPPVASPVVTFQRPPPWHAMSMTCEADGNLVVAPGLGPSQVIRVDTSTGKDQVLSTGGLIEGTVHLAIVPGRHVAEAEEAP